MLKQDHWKSSTFQAQLHKDAEAAAAHGPGELLEQAVELAAIHGMLVLQLHGVHESCHGGLLVPRFLRKACSQGPCSRVPAGSRRKADS